MPIFLRELDSAAKKQTHVGMGGLHFCNLLRREIDHTDETTIAREHQQFPICTDIDLAKPTQ